MIGAENHEVPTLVNVHAMKFMNFYTDEGCKIMLNTFAKNISQNKSSGLEMLKRASTRVISLPLNLFNVKMELDVDKGPDVRRRAFVPLSPSDRRTPNLCLPPPPKWRMRNQTNHGTSVA